MKKTKEVLNRVSLLDGVRGLLSLVVVFNHSFLVVAIPSYANVWGQNYLSFTDISAKIQQLFMIIGNGGTAVSMFFVLSGFVLNFSLKNFQWQAVNYLHFLKKRLLRLYPAFVFTIILISIGRWLGFDYRVFPYASSWYLWWMNFNLDVKEFLKNLFFININLGGVTWTLRVIMIFSFFAPLFHYISKKLSKAQNLAFVFLLTYLSFNLLNIHNFRDLRYFYMFYLGLIIPQFEIFFKKITNRLFNLLIIPALVLIFTIRYQTNEYFGGVIESYVSWFILGVIIYKQNLPTLQFLNSKWLQFLGSISYSLYLIHFSVLYTIARILFQYFPSIDFGSHYLATHIFLLFSSAIVTIPTSYFVHKYIENLPEIVKTK